MCDLQIVFCTSLSLFHHHRQQTAIVETESEKKRSTLFSFLWTNFSRLFFSKFMAQASIHPSTLAFFSFSLPSNLKRWKCRTDWLTRQGGTVRALVVRGFSSSLVNKSCLGLSLRFVSGLPDAAFRGTGWVPCQCLFWVSCTLHGWSEKGEKLYS